MTHTCSNIQHQNELFYQEIKEFLDVKKLKGLIFSVPFKSVSGKIKTNFVNVETSEPVKKKVLQIEEKIEKPKTNERSLF